MILWCTLAAIDEHLAELAPRLREDPEAHALGDLVTGGGRGGGHPTMVAPTDDRGPHPPDVLAGVGPHSHSGEGVARAGPRVAS